MKNEKGFVLIWVMIVAAMVATMIPMMSKQVIESVNRQAKRKLRAEYLLLVNSIRQQLEDPLVCKELLRGRQISLSPAAPNVDVAVASQELPTGVVETTLAYGFGSNVAPIGAGWESPGGNVKVRSVRIRTLARVTNPNGAPRTIRLDKPGNQTYETYRIRLQIVSDSLPLRLSDRTPEEFAQAGLAFVANTPFTPEYAIDLFANVVESTDVIYNCFGIHSPAAACEAVGGGFDADQVQPQFRCHPDRRCFQSRVGLVNDPGLCQNPHTTAEQIGVVNGVNRYLCSWCRDGIANFQ